MKGIVCEEINLMRMVELEEPTLTDGAAIVSIRRIGICGTDMHAYRGNQPFFSYPRFLGHELSGFILEVNDESGQFQIGDQVCIIPYMHCGVCIACRQGKTNCCTDMKVLGVHIDGGMRERITIPTSHLIKTNGITLDQAVVLEPFSIGAHAVRRSDLQPGDVAVVIGGGPIGLGVMAIAKQRGATVIAMDINDERLTFCQQWAKVDHTVNALQQHKDQIAAITGGDYPIAVFDATGNSRSMTDAFSLVAHGGKLIYVGLVKADISFNDPEFHKREMTLMGSRNATKEDFDTVLDAIGSGHIDVNSFITHRAPFDEMIDNFESWLKPETQVIKAVVELLE
ncbi:MAG: zinc-binding alcohol dehydrogenase family protein [Paenibacillaceae bacterium]